MTDATSVYGFAHPRDCVRDRAVSCIGFIKALFRLFLKPVGTEQIGIKPKLVPARVAFFRQSQVDFKGAQ